MKWELLLNEKENILSVKTFGIFDLASKTELMRECLAVIGKQDCCRCLIDNSKIESTSIRFMEMYSIPEKFSELSVPHNLSIAEVVSEKHIQDFRFLETICRNNGYLLSVFSDVELALQWLRQ